LIFIKAKNLPEVDLMSFFGFSAELRLLQAADFKSVFDEALYKVHQSGFMLLARPCSNQSLDHARIGLVIAKRKIKRAHERNRVKRLSRESFRLHQAELPALDIVLMAKADAQHLPNNVLQQELTLAWQQLIRRVQKNQTIASPKPAEHLQNTDVKSKKNTDRNIHSKQVNSNNSKTSAVILK
jgi:ribonuclease P protein component